MKNTNKIVNIIEAIVIIVLGVIIAIFGGGTALDIYFGIVAIVGGVALAAIAVYTLAKTKDLQFGTTFLSIALITVAITLFVNALSFGVLIGLLVYIMLALGITLVLYGIYTAVALKGIIPGVAQIVIGAAIIVLTVLFLTVEDFRTVFWIITGILVAVYGVLMLISAFLPQKKAK